MPKEGSQKIRIVKIAAGTVIDHIAAGHALDVLNILGITGEEDNIMTLAMNITSSRIGRKDIVKLEDRILEDEEVAKIALVAPDATINVIENEEVVKKTRVQLPDRITNVVECPNARCITNKEREPIEPKYQVLSRCPTQLKCLYCWTLIEESDIISQFTERR
ncbi:MAG: aspartate carbamoyltransferase regulatory subunit [Candidatus Lokiarchaeota archaeon]|nr:aspartate carbamoyltransferase regulatory subunit [Candidatus Lokiarchaeota archaeon]